MSEMIEFADLNRLGNVLKNAKRTLDNSKMPVQNKQVQESIDKTNTPIGGEMDLDEKPMPNLTEQYYNRMGVNATSHSNENLFDFSEDNMNNSKLPQAVIEAMRKGQNERRSSMNTASGMLSEDLVKSINKKSPQNIQTPAPVSGVDYSLIKSIVEECMKKYTSSIKKTLINESKGNSLELITQQGNTFKFVTTDGKVFEGKMVYKGNIKEK